MVGRLMPNSPGELALSKKELGAAGFRSDAAPSIMIGTKLVVCAAFLLTGLALRTRMTDAPILRLLIPVGGAVFGYMLPGLVLDRLGRQEKRIHPPRVA